MDGVPGGYESDDDAFSFDMDNLDGHFQAWEHQNMDDLFFFDADYDQLSDDGSYGVFFSDDSDYSDRDDHNKIFVTLQDSFVLRRLHFHKQTLDRFRLPKVFPGQPECYESLYRLLEELSLLLKTWRKRTQHSFTAHISRGSVEDASNESKDELNYGVDYESHDIEHESDEWGSDDDDEQNDAQFLDEADPSTSAAAATGNKKTSNDLLTKKKYCQSSRLFYEIFDSVHQFEEFLHFVHTVKKHVFNLVFTKFMAIVGANIQLPVEIWERIWRFTQLPYREKKEDTFRVESPSPIEEDRITSLFGAVGDLHMLLFEVLFKHPYISETPVLVEVDTWEIKKSGGQRQQASYLKSLFRRFQKYFEMHFVRLQDLEQLGSKGKAASAGSSASADACELIQKIDRGMFTIEEQQVPRNKPDKWYSANEVFVFSEWSCDVLARLDEILSDRNEPILYVIVWNIALQREVARINTGVPVLVACMAPTANRNASRLFSLTSDRFAFVTRGASSEKDGFEVHQWTFDAESESVQHLDASARVGKLVWELALGEESMAQAAITFKLTQVDKRPSLVICHQNPHANESSLLLFDADSLEKRPTDLVFPSHQVHLECVKLNVAIVRDFGERAFHLCALDTLRIVESYKDEDLCKDADHDHSEPEGVTEQRCAYAVRMDSSPHRLQFAIFSQNLASYQLFDYDHSSPEVIASTCEAMVSELRPKVLSFATLYDGCLFVAHTTDCHLRSHSGDYFYDDLELLVNYVFAVDLRDATVHPVCSLLRKEYDDVEDFTHSGPLDEAAKVVQMALLNEHSRRYFVDEVAARPYLCRDDHLLVPIMGKSYLSVKLHASSASVLQEDSRQLMQIVAKQEESRARRIALEKRRKKEAHKIKMVERERARAEYVDKSKDITGRVITFKNQTFGFIKPLDDLAKKLGNIFLHRSELVKHGNRRIRVHDHVVFNIKSQDESRIRAVNVRFAPRNDFKTAKEKWQQDKK